MKKRFFYIVALIVYCLLLIKVMVFKDLPTFRIGQLMINFAGTDGGHPANFVPFATIVPYLFGYKGLIIAGVNLVGNIALLIPVGFMVPFILRNISWMQSLILAFASGLIIEIMQTILRVGIFDIDDVILNALGVMIGYWIFLVLTRWLRERKYTYIVVAVLIVIAACAGALYEIYPHGEELVIPQQGADLCGGTHGTGEIISKGEHTITIRRNDGTIQTFKITEQTEIKSSAGTITEADLKVGDRATLVVYDNETATGIFVCGRGF